MDQTYRKAGTAVVLALSASFGFMTAGTAHETADDEGKICNPVQESDTDAVLSGSGRYIKHGGTFDCPEPEPEPVVEVTPEPEPAPEPVVIASISSDVAFDLNKAILKPEAYAELDEVVEELQTDPDARFEVVGHADSTGKDDYNQDLSERRAKAVANYLENAGISRSRFEISGRGESEPLASNETKEGRAQNRRVELKTL